MQFADIKGLQDTKQHLVNAIKHNHLAHALLFLGPEGSPNLALALAMATYINCEDKQEADACGLCPSCQKMAKLVHPDVNFVYPSASRSKEDEEKDPDPDKKSDIQSLWRQFLIDFPYGNINDWMRHTGLDNKQLIISVGAARQIVKTLSLKSFEGGYKIMLIWLPELMNTQAANAILKILEEPPAKTLFFMVGNHIEQLLTTIRSRVQVVQVRLFSDEEILSYLSEAGIAEPRAREIARLADGSLREAYRLLEEDEDESTQQFKTWMRLCYNFDFTAIVRMSDAFFSMTKESQKGLFSSGLAILHESLVKDAAADELLRVLGDDLVFVQNFSKVLTADKILALSQQLSESIYHLERNANPRIIFTNLSLQLGRIMRT